MGSEVYEFCGDLIESISGPYPSRALVTERNGVRVLTTFIEVGHANQHARRQYAAMWQAKFGFPAPVELLDRWWPLPVGSAP